ncbi:hypothetical protein PEBR_18915 [Penicillium brasilianum]|uniref:Rhodopsin domain-containing protein n=1 Tax=Penicillium brasilianum TaxID=104259 RepID=A0A1S9RN99_PENBI|nr:hypothetical protein PEBR_18915 [Penicillium brasilianum]
MLLWGVQMPVKAKTSVYILLGLGSIASTATIVRIPYLAGGAGRDLLLPNIAVIFWAIVELSISIIATSAATWRPLFAKPAIDTSASHINLPVRGGTCVPTSPRDLSFSSPHSLCYPETVSAEWVLHEGREDSMTPIDGMNLRHQQSWQSEQSEQSELS